MYATFILGFILTLSVIILQIQRSSEIIKDLKVNVLKKKKSFLYF